MEPSKTYFKVFSLSRWHARLGAIVAGRKKSKQTRRARDAGLEVGAFGEKVQLRPHELLTVKGLVNF